MQPPAGKDLSDIEVILVTWTSRGGKWTAKLVRNYAGAFMVMQYKKGRSCGCISAGTQFRDDEKAAIEWARNVIDMAYEHKMQELGS